MQCKPLRVGDLGVDTIANLTPSTSSLKVVGVKFAVRYLGGLTPSELSAILSAGLGLMPCCYSPPWPLDGAAGARDGATAVGHLKALGLPPGATVWCDLEGPSTTPAEIMAYVTNWALQVKQAGFDPGLYVGFGAKLTSKELYSLPVDRYWHSLSRVTDEAGNIAEPDCGWCMHQLYPTTVLAGVGVDIDVVQQDFQGRTPNAVTT